MRTRHTVLSAVATIYRTEETRTMARIDVPDGESKEASRVWQLVPHMAGAIGAMSEAVYEKSSLPIREREVARMRIAQLNKCDV